MSFKHAGAFIFGAIIGGATIYLFVKDHFEKKADAEIQEIRELYANASSNAGKETPELENTNIPQPVEDVVDAAIDIIKDAAYGTGTEKAIETPAKATRKPAKKKKTDLCVISSDEYDTNSAQYEKRSFTYYADGVLAEEETVLDIDSTIGQKNFDIFTMTYEDMYFKDDSIGVMYELIYDNHTYSSVYIGE